MVTSSVATAAMAGLWAGMAAQIGDRQAKIAAAGLAVVCAAVSIGLAFTAGATP
jgi:hypothetical protein